MPEMIAYVDDFDHVLRIVPRKEAHQRGYNVRIAAVLVFNSKGEIILQKVSSNKNKDAGRWSYSAAGHVDVGEDYPIAAIRELKEELGIDGEIKEYIGLSRTIDPILKKKKSFHRVYKVIHDGPYKYDPSEADCIQAFSVETLKEMIRSHPENFKSNLLDIFEIMGIK